MELRRFYSRRHIYLTLILFNYTIVSIRSDNEKERNKNRIEDTESGDGKNAETIVTECVELVCTRARALARLRMKQKWDREKHSRYEEWSGTKDDNNLLWQSLPLPLPNDKKTIFEYVKALIEAESILVSFQVCFFALAVASSFFCLYATVMIRRSTN